ncbi:class I SAM-dependent methyltransferase [Nocardioides sp. Kera G14]|uniref:class I SAM-dependent methyltransferase n=1 Tax=Nocardioides sp. Kera G14 TaxID=2884264 RepID=UPI001D12E0FD|nr:methyltransferase [Nocardioides sp. Kera G14]UDY24288.1 class I SAM-dependent methyltransferase [Nocardioides sp. Kera G14]
MSDAPDETEQEHYFSADPSVPFERIPVRAEVWDETLPLVSGSGVFAKGRLDIGTSVLFKETSPPALAAGQRVLDAGCGYGVIGLALARLLPEVEVVGVDVNERALLLANENAASLGLANYRAVLPDDPDAQGEWDEIWSNPPIRIGKPALHELLLTWLPRLTPDGRAVMVVGKNLGADSLQRWLGEQGLPTTRIGSAKGFRVLETRREA